MRAIWAGFILSFALFAQQSGDYSISGTVVNSETGEPVKYALVTLIAQPVFDPEHPPQKPMMPLQKHAQGV